MSKDYSKRIWANFYLTSTTYAPPVLLRDVELNVEDVRLDRLRSVARKLLGVDVFVLYDGGLLLGASSGTVLLERATFTPGAPGETVTVQNDSRYGDPLHSSNLDMSPPIAAPRPWQRPGWFAEARWWVNEQLTMRGEELRGKWRQVSTNDLASVIRFSTTGGDVFLKCAEEPIEVAVLPGMSVLVPDLTPEVLATDEPRGLLLTKNGGTHLAQVDVLADWVEAITRLAHAHQVLPTHLIGGFRPQTLPFSSISAAASDLLLDEDGLRGWGLPDEFVERLPELLSALNRAHQHVADFALADTIVHGDAHPMNALVGERGVTWFDWQEASLGNPLLDAGWFLAWLTHPGRSELPIRRNCPVIAEILWDRYLEDAGIDVSHGSERTELMWDAMLMSLTHRAVAFDHRYRQWRGNVEGWRPLYTPYTLRWLVRAASMRQQAKDDFPS